jgi:Uma2 family endonuclease
LAIEVIYTSGGVDTLEIYQRLGVGEVWFLQDRQLKIYCLQDNNYQQTIQSELLPDLDLALLAQYVIISDPLEAVVEWRKQVRVN